MTMVECFVLWFVHSFNSHPSLILSYVRLGGGREVCVDDYQFTFETFEFDMKILVFVCSWG